MSRADHKRFSIDDAFEEETDEAIRVCSHQHPHQHQLQHQHQHPHPQQNPQQLQPPSHTTRTYKCTDDTTSRDSDSLIHDYLSANETTDVYCWKHPRVKENWKTVLAAVALLLFGIGLVCTGIFAIAEPDHGIQGVVFLVAGLICFVPGAYHVVYICLAARGQRGYDFYHLPLFT